MLELGQAYASPRWSLDYFAVSWAEIFQIDRSESLSPFDYHDLDSTLLKMYRNEPKILWFMRISANRSFLAAKNLSQLNHLRDLPM